MLLFSSAKIKKSERSGAGADDIYRPSIWYFENLSFLHEQESFIEGPNTFDDASNIVLVHIKKYRIN